MIALIDPILWRSAQPPSNCCSLLNKLRYYFVSNWRPSGGLISGGALSLSLFQQEPRAIRQLISMLVRLRRSPLCTELSNQLRLHYRTLFCHQISEIFFFFLNTILVLKKKREREVKVNKNVAFIPHLYETQCLATWCVYC